MSKQLKRINGFSIAKSDADIMVKFINTVEIKKQVTNNYNKLRPAIIQLLNDYKCKDFNLFYNDTVKKIVTSERNNPAVDLKKLEEKYPEAYKECVKYSKSLVISVK